jgi:peroxiredoxin Q/BCP
MASVAVGKKVPAFSAASTGGGKVGSKDLAGTPFVLYFYPKDDTPGCTREGEGFRDAQAKFKKLGVRVFGVSRDTLASHDKFRAKYGLTFDLLSDPDEKLCKQFDVIKEKNMYGRKVLGIERSTFLVDAEGTLRNEWRKVKVDRHVDEVLEAARALR